MSNSKFLVSCFLYFFFISFASSFSSFNNTHKCSAQQSIALLTFKESLSSINFSFEYPNISPCEAELGSGYYPLMTNWKSNSDCCMWDGVTCNHFTGDVIALDLSCGMLEGTIYPNTTLFHLPHLQSLNLAFNYFYSSTLPHGIGRLSNSLTHLNISSSGFTGQIPQEILFLSKLVSVDLSFNSVVIQPSVMNNLLQNCTDLRELRVFKVNISSWVLPTSLNVSSSLKTLDLRSSGLQGKLPEKIFNLPYLEQLYLSDNLHLTGPLPQVHRNTTNRLQNLDVSSCGLVGSLPESFVNLKYLVSLDLSVNMLNGTLPAFLFTLPLLENIILHVNMFRGGIPLDLFNHSSLKRFSVSHNQLDGEINVDGSTQLINLIHLDLSHNNLLGEWELDFLLSILPNLKVLDLSYSGLSGVANNGTNNVNLDFRELGLASCKLPVFPESLRSMKNLEYLDLSNNRIRDIPDWVGEIGGHRLYSLDLSHNFITGLPQFDQWVGLTHMYLRSNQIQGSFPLSICNMNQLNYLDISSNRFGGMIPQCLENISFSLHKLDVHSNQLQGSFPPSICNMSYLQFLDMSNNNFSGVISNVCEHDLIYGLILNGNHFEGGVPSSLSKYKSLKLLDLGNNHLNGTIPDVYNKEYGGLEGLILNGNQLEGEVPSSLSKCQSLKVLDLGNNHLNGTFPGWLGDLQNLQVLVLRSNNFHGIINETYSTMELPFPSLQVLDLSRNRFVGHLPAKYFQNFIMMKDVVRKGPKTKYLYAYLLYYSIIVVEKDVEMTFPRIFVDYTFVDLSRNLFEGEIPNVTCSLHALKVLNLSHNKLNGRIPHAIGDLSEIESLDLSWNQLIGEIPNSLAGISNLEVLNLSQNHLVGRIPEGKQFNTFDGNSFGGNSGLCGFPLPNQCEHPSSRPVVEENGHEESGFPWKALMMGYGFGTMLGLVMGYVMLSTGRPKWFNAIADAGELMIGRWRNKRKYM